MSHKFLHDVNFHLLLIKIDEELAENTLKQGCSYCHHPLHQSDYPRSPLGLSQSLRQYYEQRISFCCSLCRKRNTPLSVRFFGRRWFPAPLLVLISAFMCGINERTLAQIKRHFNITVSESTWKRWRTWWRELFITTPFWHQAKGLFPPGIDTSYPFPRSLLNLFQGTLQAKMISLLKFLSPLTAGVLRAV